MPSRQHARAGTLAELERKEDIADDAHQLRLHGVTQPDVAECADDDAKTRRVDDDAEQVQKRGDRRPTPRHRRERASNGSRIGSRDGDCGRDEDRDEDDQAHDVFPRAAAGPPTRRPLLVIVVTGRRISDRSCEIVSSRNPRRCASRRMCGSASTTWLASGAGSRLRPSCSSRIDPSTKPSIARLTMASTPGRSVS